MKTAEGARPVADKPQHSISTSAAFLAYETALAVGFIALFTPYALLRMIRTTAYRAGLAERLSLRPETQERNRGANPVWIQAVSMGEVKSVAPLVRRINAGAERSVLLTSTTETGFRVANEMFGTDNAISYFPIDFTPIVKRRLSRIRPRVIVLFETEIWPNFIRAATSMQIPVSIVNGRISEKSFRHYRLIPRIFRNVFSMIDYAGMQSSRDADRAVALGARPEIVCTCGNMKFDAAPAPPTPRETEDLRRQLMLGQNDILIVAGSTHEGEELSVINAYKAVLPRFQCARLLVAPRHPERFDEVESLIRKAGLKVWRRSRRDVRTESNSGSVILLDTIGELASVYGLASLTFVGGSLTKVGGHNIIEPAALGKPLLFGPHMHHFEDVKDAFLSRNAAICVNDEKELILAVSNLLEKPSEAKALGEAGRRVVEENRGATDRYFEALKRYL